jgi:hypothetical protein
MTRMDERETRLFETAADRIHDLCAEFMSCPSERHKCEECLHEWVGGEMTCPRCTGGEVVAAGCFVGHDPRRCPAVMAEVERS